MVNTYDIVAPFLFKWRPHKKKNRFTTALLVADGEHNFEVLPISEALE